MSFKHEQKRKRQGTKEYSLILKGWHEEGTVMLECILEYQKFPACDISKLLYIIFIKWIWDDVITQFYCWRVLLSASPV